MLITLPMEIGGKYSLMLFDTCADGTMLDNSKLEPGMKRLGAGRVHDYAGNSVESQYVELSSMKFRSREWANVPAAVFDLEKISFITGVPVGGILGVSEFKDSKLFIDYEAMNFTMHRGDWLLAGAKVRELPLLPKEAHPKFKAVIEGVEVTFSIDTGQNNAVSLESSLFDRLVEKGVIKKDEAEARSHSLAINSRSTTGDFVSGELMGKSLKGLTVYREANSLIGIGWLAGFRTEIDFPGLKLRYVPAAKERKAILAERMLGAFLAYKNGRGSIVALKPGGKGAMEAVGLKEQDEIVSLGGAEYLTWEVVLEMLHKNAHKRIKATYKRPGVEGIREAEIQLPGLITEWDEEIKDEGQTDSW